MAALSGLPRVALAWPRGRPGPHPEPRPGITAERVLTHDQIHDAELRPVYDMVREIPHIVDGIRCHCGCADITGYYSLLTCYEDNGMAQHCLICQGQAKLVHRLHKDGWSLDGIRAAVDARFGSS